MAEQQALEELSRILGHTFKNIKLLEEALTHPSISSYTERRDYERLEFLGDRVLGFIIASLLFKRFQEDDEGKMALRFSNLVRREALVRIASDINLDEFVIITKGVRRAGIQHRTSILADSCEAIIAALYLDGGVEVAGQFVEKQWEELIVKSSESRKDAKSRLQEWAQKLGKPIPVYNVVDIKGPDNNPFFTVEVLVEGVDPAQAQGSSKRVAEQAAAAVCLARLKE